jgi:5-methylthioadenosine/S-adenosylhomocysteine deaminase
MILVKGATTLDGQRVNVYLSDSKISRVTVFEEVNHFDGTTIEASGLVVTTPLWNMHTHAGMTLLRGYGEGTKLMDWLENYIWPAERHLTEELVYHGTRLACLEMIKSGTVGFMDMYWYPSGAARAVDEMGMRAVIGAVVFDNQDASLTKACQERVSKELKEVRQIESPRIKCSVAPHAIYTVSGELLQWAYELTEGVMPYHIHLSETEHEVNQCLETHGMRPTEYLASLGVLGNNTYAAHSCWLSPEEVSLYGKFGVKAVTNPVSNLKLANGKICPVKELQSAGVEVLIGTDGCASNNNLDLFEEMKFTSLLQKHCSEDPTVLPPKEVWEMGSRRPAKVMGLDYGIFAGATADLMLLDLKVPSAVPATDLTSHLVYSLNGSIVDTLICDGKILMKHRQVPHENEILEQAQKAANQILNKK